jgi:hypothetical protein
MLSVVAPSGAPQAYIRLTCRFFLRRFSPVSGIQREQLEDLLLAHRLEARVVLRDDRVGRLKLELLQTHDLLLHRVASDQPIDVHNLEKIIVSTSNYR